MNTGRTSVTIREPWNRFAYSYAKSIALVPCERLVSETAPEVLAQRLPKRFVRLRSTVGQRRQFHNSTHPILGEGCNSRILLSGLHIYCVRLDTMKRAGIKKCAVLCYAGGSVCATPLDCHREEARRLVPAKLKAKTEAIHVPSSGLLRRSSSQ